MSRGTWVSGLNADWGHWDLRPHAKLVSKHGSVDGYKRSINWSQCENPIVCAPAT